MTHLFYNFYSSLFFYILLYINIIKVDTIGFDVGISMGETPTNLRTVLTNMNATKLVELFDTYHLGHYLDENEQQITILAPPNEGLDETLIPPTEIREWLRYHILDRRYSPQDLVDGALLVTKAGRDLLGDNNKQRIRVHVTVQDKVMGAIYDTKKQSIQFGGSAVVGEPVSTTSSYVFPISQSVTLPRDVLDQLPTNLDLSTFVAVLYQSESDLVLRRAKGMTLFAPTNEAFERLGMLTKHLLQPNNKKKLAQVLQFHAIQGVYYSNEMAYGEISVPTLSRDGHGGGEDIYLNKTESGIFMRGFGAADGNDRSVIGQVVTSEEQMLTRNGALLKVDRVQLPALLKVTNHDLLTSSGTTTSFLDLLEQAHLVDLLDAGSSTSSKVYVVLAPSDRAFNKMNFTRLLEDQDLLMRVAKLHILPVAMPQMALLGDSSDHHRAHKAGNTHGISSDEHQEITTHGTEFETLYDNERVVVTLVEDDTGGGSIYTVHIKGSLQDKAQVIGMGRVTNGGGVIEIDRVLLPSNQNNMFALSWWYFLLIVVSVLAISALIVISGYYIWLWWKRRQEGYQTLDDQDEQGDIDEQQQESSRRYG